MEKHGGFEVGNENARFNVLCIHGYSASPDVFRKVAESISTKLDVRFVAPLLPGHGTKQNDLLQYSFEDLLDAARRSALAIRDSGKPFIIVGHSLGTYMATILADELQPRALVLALMPYVPRIWWYLPGLESVICMRDFWSKRLTPQEIETRRGVFYYPNIPSKFFPFVRTGNARVAKILPRLSIPILTINTKDDPWVNPSTAQRVLDESGKNLGNESHISPTGRHSVFFPPEYEQQEKILREFLSKNLS